MYSCNVPVPPDVSRLARGLAAECLEATPRDRHTLVCKRLGDGDPAALADRIRGELAGLQPFEARVTGVDVFENPPVGRGPVAYLRIESARLAAIHRVLCASFDPIAGVEGDDYVPHVTITRGRDADRIAGRDLDPIIWSVEALSIWSATYDEPVERISLPI